LTVQVKERGVIPVPAKHENLIKLFAQSTLNVLLFPTAYPDIFADIPDYGGCDLLARPACQSSVAALAGWFAKSGVGMNEERAQTWGRWLAEKLFPQLDLSTKFRIETIMHVSAAQKPVEACDPATQRPVDATAAPTVADDSPRSADVELEGHPHRELLLCFSDMPFINTERPIGIVPEHLVIEALAISDEVLSTCSGQMMEALVYLVTNVFPGRSFPRGQHIEREIFNAMDTAERKVS
jgi:hypothetical protein